MALDGWECSELSGPATWPRLADDGQVVQAVVLGELPAGEHEGGGAVGQGRGVAGGDGAVRGERRAQAGRAISTVVSGRTPSSAVDDDGIALALLDARSARSRRRRRRPWRPGRRAGATRPPPRPARSGRCRGSGSCVSVDRPMDCPSKASVRPSWAATSRAWTVPYVQPWREPGSRCGARVMDSWPPATTTVASPLRIIRAASITAVRPGEADLVDGDGGDVPADAGADGALPRRVLARSGLQDLAHDHRCPPGRP